MSEAQVFSPEPRGPGVRATRRSRLVGRLGQASRARWGARAGVAAALAAVSGLATPAAATSPHAAAAPDVSIQIFSRSPVLVRAGERVRIPVDVACVSGGSPCRAEVTMSVRDPDGAWRGRTAGAATGLRFDLSAPASRAAPAGRIEYRLSARDALGNGVTLPAAGSLQVYVTGRMRSVDLPATRAGRIRTGATVLYMPWGSGPGSAGLSVGDESATVGPSSFDVDAAGRIHVADLLHGRIAVFRGGNLLREVPAPLPARTDIAVSAHGVTYAASQEPGQTVVARRLAPDGTTLDERPAGTGVLSAVRATGARGFVRTLPLDAWVPVGGGAPSTGRPVPGGGVLLQSVVGNAVRLGIATGDRVSAAIEVRSSETLGELALAEPNGRGGYVVVVHVVGSTAAADRYEVVRVHRDLTVSAFAVPNESYAETIPLSRFRLGRDGNLYRMATSPDGVRIVRYRIGGSR